MRCFIAIDFPRNVMNSIAGVQKELQNKKVFHGKITELENLHLTLKFLGEIPEERVEEVKKILKTIKFSKFNSSLGELGIFNPRFIRLVWIHILGGKILELQKQIDEKLKDLFPVEERFMSHLTIARVKNIKDKKLFLEELKKIRVPKMEFPIERFSWYHFTSP